MKKYVWYHEKGNFNAKFVKLDGSVLVKAIKKELKDNNLVLDAILNTTEEEIKNCTMYSHKKDGNTAQEYADRTLFELCWC